MPACTKERIFFLCVYKLNVCFALIFFNWPVLMMTTNWLLPFLGKMKNDESNKETSSEMDYLENATVIDESTLTPEQRLGLKQAEERLERDHIFRLEKVYTMTV